MRRFTLSAFAAASLCISAPAVGKPQTLEDLFVPLSHGACVSIDDVRAIGATVQLTPEQFQFVRAFWMAIPPASRELPPGDKVGDKAFLAKEPDGVAVLGLFDDGGQICAVFPATDWLERVVDEVGRGETGELGQAM
jgi:hypothetical protein